MTQVLAGSKSGSRPASPHRLWNAGPPLLHAFNHFPEVMHGALHMQSTRPLAAAAMSMLVASDLNSALCQGHLATWRWRFTAPLLLHGRQHTARQRTPSCCLPDQLDECVKLDGPARSLNSSLEVHGDDGTRVCEACVASRGDEGRSRHRRRGRAGALGPVPLSQPILLTERYVAGSGLLLQHSAPLVSRLCARWALPASLQCTWAAAMTLHPTPDRQTEARPGNRCSTDGCSSHGHTGDHQVQQHVSACSPTVGRQGLESMGWASTSPQMAIQATIKSNNMYQHALLLWGDKDWKARGGPAPSHTGPYRRPSNPATWLKGLLWAYGETRIGKQGKGGRGGMGLGEHRAKRMQLWWTPDSGCQYGLPAVLSAAGQACLFCSPLSRCEAGVRLQGAEVALLPSAAVLMQLRHAAGQLGKDFGHLRPSHSVNPGHAWLEVHGVPCLQQGCL